MSAPVVSVKDLRFNYGRAEVLHGVSFEIMRGELVGLLGPNGAGKSTTIKILTGILELASGEVSVDGLQLPDDAVALKRRVGYVPEAAELYDTLSAIEFLELCGRLHDLDDDLLARRIEASLDAFDLNGQGHASLGSYSKGMRQKVLIAAALLHDPSIVFLDEPLTGLDVDAAVMVKALLAALAARGRTICYSSHVLDVVERLCTRVVIIDRGVVVADGSPDTLTQQVEDRTLEDVFREITHRGSVAPRVDRIMSLLAP